MPEMTDPMDALISFQPAFRVKELAVQKAELDASIFVYVDRPLGEPHFTYVRAKAERSLRWSSSL